MFRSSRSLPPVAAPSPSPLHARRASEKSVSLRLAADAWRALGGRGSGPASLSALARVAEIRSLLADLSGLVDSYEAEAVAGLADWGGESELCSDAYRLRCILGVEE